MLLAVVFILMPCLMVQGKSIDQRIEESSVEGYSSELENGVKKVELDILLTPEQQVSSYKAISYQSHRWTNKEVPYTIDNSFSSRDMTVLNQSFDDYHRWTCIRFKPRRSEKNYIQLVNGGGCSSFVGMINWGGQRVTLASRGCRTRDTIVHELGHAIGFQHEQTRPDRDTYLTVYRQNIVSGMEYNFDKHSTAEANSYGVKYDYGSVMHYGQYFFSKNGKKTMVTKDPYWQTRIGYTTTLSFSDLKLANHIYSCGAHCGGKTCTNGGYVDKNCKCQCPGNSGGYGANPIKECGSSGGGDGGGDGGDGGGDGGKENGCTDNIPGMCPQWKSEGLCDDSSWNSYMDKECAKTCGRVVC